MDFGELDTKKAADSGASFYPTHPATGDYIEDESTGELVEIRLMGSDSTAYRKAVKRIAERRAGQRKKHMTLDELEDQSSALLAACTASWKHVERDGEPLECTEENAEQLYRDFPWLREQVDAFIADRANFFTKSSRS